MLLPLAVALQVDTAIVGCGVPGRGMGWFHGHQLVNNECPSARLTDVIEPWFLGGGRSSPAGEAFQSVVEEWKDVRFCDSFDSLFSDSQGKCMALIAGRTADNPKLFRAAIDNGATHVLLEKPGAPSVAELEDMASYAAAMKVPVYMGFIKNIASYVSEALDKATPECLVTFVSLNDYTEDSLGECFARNSEGMLKNMAIHELALAASYFDVNVDTIKDVEVDPENCELRTIGDHTDFVKLDFTLCTADRKVRIVADRCGGDGCSAIVSDKNGDVVKRTDMIDKDRMEIVAKRHEEHPDWIGYLLTQEEEYKELKERCARAALDGSDPAGVATIHTAIDALKLAEHLTPLLQAKLTPRLQDAAQPVLAR